METNSKILHYVPNPTRKIHGHKNMKTARIASIYSIFVGIAMLGLWVMLLSTNQVPELASEPYRIIAHILAEIATAVLLLIGGYGLLKKQTWGMKAFLFSQGALFYTLIASPGYYIQLGAVPIVAMFIILLVITLIFLGQAILRPNEFELNGK